MTWQNDDEATHIFGGNDPALDAPWQVNVSEADTRTMTAVEIGFEYGRGVLDANDTFVWREGMREWAPLGVCPELIPVLAQFQAQRQRSITPPPLRVSAAPHNPLPGPMFAPTPSFAPPAPRPPQISVQFSAPAALSSGLSPLRGPSPSYAPPPEFAPQALAAEAAPAKRSSAVKSGLIVGGLLGVLSIAGIAAFLLTRAPAPGASSSAGVAVLAPSATIDPVAGASSAVAVDPVAEGGAAPVVSAAPEAATAAPTEDAKKGATATSALQQRGAVRADTASTSAAPEKKDAPTKETKGGADLEPFNVNAARSALSSAAGGASGCGRPNGPTGRGRATVTFAPSGAVANAQVDPPFAGTPVGSCAVAAFRGARVPAFSGGAQSVTKSFNVK